MSVDVNGLITALLPGVTELVKAFHTKVNPGAPPLTDEQVKQGLRDAVAASLAEDDRAEADIRARNPPPQG